MRLTAFVVAIGGLAVLSCGTAWCQSGDVIADRTCHSANQIYCDGGMEKSCTKVGQVNGRPLWTGVITGHNENCLVREPKRVKKPPAPRPKPKVKRNRATPASPKKARCYGLMHQWNAKRLAFNHGQCKRYYPGTALAVQCPRLKAQLLAERASIARQCAGILQVSPGPP